MSTNIFIPLYHKLHTLVILYLWVVYVITESLVISHWQEEWSWPSDNQHQLTMIKVHWLYQPITYTHDSSLITDYTSLIRTTATILANNTSLNAHLVVSLSCLYVFVCFSDDRQHGDEHVYSGPVFIPIWINAILKRILL